MQAAKQLNFLTSKLVLWYSYLHVCECVLDGVWSCADVTDSSGTLTNDDSYVTPLRQRHSSEHEDSHLSFAGMLQLNAANESTEIAKKHMSVSRCSVCSQDQVKNTAAEASQLTTEPQLSDEERQFLELQRSHGAIPKCRSDQRPRSYYGNFFAFVCLLYFCYKCAKLIKCCRLKNVVSKQY